MTSPVVDVLRRLLDIREQRAADLRPAMIVGRNPDGSAQLLRLDGECVSRGGAGGYQGEIVTLQPALLQRNGTSGVARANAGATVATLWVERLDPDTLISGTTMDVSVIGGGFTATTEFEFLRADSEEINSDITILSSTFVDDRHVTLHLSIVAGADLFPVSAPIAYDDLGVPS